MKRTAVLNVVGLSDSVLGNETPRINAFLQAGSKSHINPVLPAVTCSAQSTYLTGVPHSMELLAMDGMTGISQKFNSGNNPITWWEPLKSGMNSG
jgi:hypothetical protein